MTCQSTKTTPRAARKHAGASPKNATKTEHSPAVRESKPPGPWLPWQMLRALLLTSVLSAASLAVPPPAPGLTSGSGDHGMKHAGIGLTGTQLSVHFDAPPVVPLTMISGQGVDFTPGKFAVLEDKYFNAQYGWLPRGFINLPADRSIWIQRTSVSQPTSALLQVYEAGNMSMEVGEGMANWTFHEIYAADGASWQWDGKMQHDYYVADLPGSYSMVFDIYVADPNGLPDSAFQRASTTFEFVVVPEPTGWALACPTLIGLWLRRR